LASEHLPRHLVALLGSANGGTHKPFPIKTYLERYVPRGGDSFVEWVCKRVAVDDTILRRCCQRRDFFHRHQQDGLTRG
jgi:hypothetical protein